MRMHKLNGEQCPFAHNAVAGRRGQRSLADAVFRERHSECGMLLRVDALDTRYWLKFDSAVESAG